MKLKQLLKSKVDLYDKNIVLKAWCSELARYHKLLIKDTGRSIS